MDYTEVIHCAASLMMEVHAAPGEVYLNLYESIFVLKDQ